MAVLVRRLGRLPWDAALKEQQRVVSRLQQDPTAQDQLLVVEHPPTYTVGRRVEPDAAEQARLEALGADYFHAKRGGDITFHGPGQLVIYPIFNLRNYNQAARWYVCRLEKSVIRACKHFGIDAETSADTGVWVGNSKIAAIGCQITRRVTSHGLALNCNTDMTWFSNIVPCGLVGKGVTSLTQQTDREVTMDEALVPMLEAFSSEFDREMVPHP
eukprot:m.31714 g.31714  ORF g.31714 m.31714 type:complete len:215 (+) comp9819_c0_seq2:226-870(+)